MEPETEIIDGNFFNRKTLKVAKELLGCFLCIKKDGKIYRFKLTEVEAYVGPHDLACHSSKGRTKRVEPMFMEAGTIYIYLIYGTYWMLNVVTEKKDYPAAILIRGVENINGPGRVTKILGIDKRFNGKKANKTTGLWFEKGEFKKGEKIIATPRIGVNYAGPIWANKKYRFYLK